MDERWVTLKDGRKVKIKTTNEYMNDLIRNKNKKETFDTIEAETAIEYKQKRKDYIDKNMEINEVDKNGFKKLKAMVDGKVVGSINYEIKNGQVNVSYVYVNSEYRRSGIGTKLYKELQSKTPDKEIIFGDFTDEGRKLINKIGTVTKKEKDEEGNIIHYGKIR